MKEYEISNNDKIIGKVNIFNDNLNKDFTSSLIKSNKDTSYEKIDVNLEQTYLIEYIVNDTDELFDIVSKYIYEHDKVFETIEKIKLDNNIKTIKKDTQIKIIVPKNYLTKLNISLDNIDFNSLLSSKIHFIKSVIPTLDNLNDIAQKLNNIINNYNNYINSNEYEFYDLEEKRDNINKYLNKIDELIKEIETNTNYRYGKNYIVPIKINNESNN